MLSGFPEESYHLKASLRMGAPASMNKDEASDLINSQINFGRAYIREARSAYESGNFEYGETARRIALNAYSTALRFCSNLLHDPDLSLIRKIEEFELELDALLEPVETGMRSIA